MVGLLYCGALLLCLAVTIGASVATNHVHAIHTRSAVGQLTRSNLSAAFITTVSAFASCAIAWAIVVNHTPQSGAFSLWYLAETLLVLMGACDFMCWTVVVAILGNAWNHGAIHKNHTSSSWSALDRYLIGKNHILWSLRRRLAGLIRR